MPTDNQQYDPNQEPEPLDYNKMWEDYNTRKKPLVEAIMSNYTKPTPQITPEQAQKAKFGAAMTDTFSTLAEMFAHSQGGRVQPRSTGSSTGTTNARLQALQDKYAQEQQQYGAIHSNAIMQDFNRALETERYNNNAKRTFYLNKQQQEEKAREREFQQKKFEAEEEDRKARREIEKKKVENTAIYNNGRLRVQGENSKKYIGTHQPKSTPEEDIAANAEAEKIDNEWLVTQGYKRKREKKDQYGNVTGYDYSWVGGTNPTLKRKLKEMYDKEKGNEPATQAKAQPKQTAVMPAIVLKQQSTGKKISNF